MIETIIKTNQIIGVRIYNSKTCFESTISIYRKQGEVKKMTLISLIKHFFGVPYPKHKKDLYRAFDEVHTKEEIDKICKCRHLQIIGDSIYKKPHIVLFLKGDSDTAYYDNDESLAKDINYLKTKLGDIFIYHK